MATRFWVGGGASTNWNAVGNTNWALTSGGANNASVPTTTDMCVFDSNSGVGISNMSAAITVQGLECDGSSLGTGAYAGTLTHAAFTLTLNTGAANTFRLSAGMTYTPASNAAIVALTHTSGTANIKLNGQKLGGLTINGAGGTTQPLDTLNVNAVGGSVLSVLSGILDLFGGAGGPFACNASSFTETGALTRSVILGGDVTIGGVTSGNSPANNVVVWNFAAAGGLTFTKNSANIIVNAPSQSLIGWQFSAGALTYNNVTIGASSGGNTMTFVGNPTYGALNVGLGWTLFFPTGTTTINSPFTWVGTKARPIAVLSNAVNGAATLSCPSGACSLTWGALAQITTTGGATFSAYNTFDLANNTGWAIFPPEDASPTGIAAAVWKDTFAGGDFATVGSVGELMSKLQNLGFTVPSMGRGVVDTGATTTTIPTSAYDPATSPSVANQLAGSVVYFDRDTSTVALRGQRAPISASSASPTPTLTVAAMTAAPAVGDKFSVV